MSRHRHLRNLDYEAELDDFDGNEYEGDGSGGMTKTQEEQMRKGLKEVRNVLGSDIPGLTDQEIQNHLWYYWFDVGQTINYILSTYGAASPKPKQRGSKKSKGGNKVSAEFWEDAPWGNIREERRANLVAPPVPKGGLLGGKTSKLALLAKSRKSAAEKKEEDTLPATQPKTSVFLLSRLENKKTHPQNPTPPAAPLSPPTELPTKFNSVPPQAPGHSRVKLPISPSPSSVVLRHEIKKPSVSTRTSIIPEKTPSPEKTSPGPLKQSSTVVKPPGQSKHAERDTENKPSCIDVFSALHALPSRFALSIFGDRIAGQGKMLFANERWIYLTGTQNGSGNNAFVGPSPDDVVQVAQSRSKGLGKTAGSPTPLKDTPAVIEGIESLNITFTPTTQSSSTADIERIAKTRKNLDVLEEYRKSNAKENVNFVVIGHVDAGKSTIMGRILYDMGVVDERTIQKYKKEAEKIGKASFALAWVLDETSEERRRGITMDVAMNKFETSSFQFTLLDAPGHKDFVPNMIAGASQADFAVLVIDSSGSSFESGFNDGGQTKEHTRLVRTLGVQRIVVAINKLDSVSWSQERFEEIQQQMTPFLTLVGFQQRNVSFVPCSGLTGDNIVKKPQEGLIPWYKGSTLIKELEKAKPLTKAVEKPFRLTIADIFRGGFTNPVSISGRIESGNIQVGDILLALPSNEKAALKGIEVDEKSSDWAVAGHNVTLHLGGIDMVHLKPGDILCDPKNSVAVASSFKMKILAFEAITPMMVDIHRGKLNMAGKIDRLIAIYAKTNGSELKKKPRRILAGSVASIEVEVLNGTIPVEVGTRIVLRSGGVTVAAGLVE